MARHYILLVSGGPDSMYLLAHYHHAARAVLHVNYARRPTADRDEQIVRQACAQWNVPLVVARFERAPGINNFQAQARAFRHAQAAKLAQHLGVTTVLSAHHKDDFLETAWWQWETKRTPRWYGIPSQTVIGKIRYAHPLLALTKRELLAYLTKHGIAYGIDETNALPLYRRNIIRQALATLDETTRTNLYAFFATLNRERAHHFARVDAMAATWAQTSYALATWAQLAPYQADVLFVVLHQHVPNLALSQIKLQNIMAFVSAANTNNSYVLGASARLRKHHRHLHFSAAVR